MPMTSDARQPQESVRILLVEDNESSRTGLERLLVLAGYRVVSAPDAESAMERAKQEHFDAVICDVNLPGASGYVFTEAYRREAWFPESAIILISADARSARRVMGLDGGADDFVEKPIDIDELLARIRSHVRQARSKQELLRRCTHDHLTGVLSRSAIEDELAREIKRATRTGLPVSVLMIDLDGFKGINDRYGHRKGDDALRRTAALLERLLRSTDRLGRVGGDEFLAVLPDTGHSDARDLVARLTLEWRRHPPRPRGVPDPICITIGCATARAGESLATLLRRADSAMYANKPHRARRSAGGDGASVKRERG